MPKQFPIMTAAEFERNRMAIGTQAEVADQMQTARKTVGRWERGDRPVPGVASVCIRLLRAQADEARSRTLEAAKELANG
jgi:DNA-binding transcriptional regulator YiaG